MNLKKSIINKDDKSQEYIWLSEIQLIKAQLHNREIHQNTSYVDRKYKISVKIMTKKSYKTYLPRSLEGICCYG